MVTTGKNESYGLVYEKEYIRCRMKQLMCDETE